VTPSSHGERARRAGRYDELSQRLPSDSPRCSAASELLVRFSNTQVVTGSDSKRSCSPAHLTNDESPSTAKPAAAMADSGVTLRRSASQRTSLSSASVKTMCTKLLDLQATRSSSAWLTRSVSQSVGGVSRLQQRLVLAAAEGLFWPRRALQTLWQWLAAMVLSQAWQRKRREWDDIIKRPA
jgi:hypothetical protein